MTVTVDVGTFPPGTPLEVSLGPLEASLVVPPPPPSPGVVDCPGADCRLVSGVLTVHWQAYPESLRDEVAHLSHPGGRVSAASTFRPSEHDCDCDSISANLSP